MSLRSAITAFATASVLGLPAAADTSPHCPASNMLAGGLLSNVCWACIFPIRFAGLDIFSSPLAAGGERAGFQLSSRPSVPAKATDKKVCVCDDGPLPTVGIPIGMWMPVALYETTYVPGCSTTLGGTVVGVSDPLYLGTEGDPEQDLSQQSFNHVHTFSYPAVLLLELFTRCNRAYQDIDILYMSEIDPMWNDPFISAYGNPMTVFGSSIAATASCAADATASSMGRPIDKLFWCGGSWSTTLGPYTGFEHNMGPVQFTSANNLQLLAMNHARGFERSTVGSDAMCQPQYEPMIQKSHYRWQVAWPRAEGRRNHASGETILRWGYGRTVPGLADTPVYLQWKWTDCCTPIIGR